MMIARANTPRRALRSSGRCGIGLFSSLGNAMAGAAHRRQQRGFRDWPEGFRCWKRRLGVAFGRDRFQERYVWDAWARSLRG